VARAISVTGDSGGVDRLSRGDFQPQWRFRRFGTALVLTQFATSVFAAPWAGAIGDRFDRRVIMIVSDLSSAGVCVAVTFSHSAIQLVALAALSSVVGAPLGPASSALLVMLVRRRELPCAARRMRCENRG
jgi:MFS family permease